MSLIIFHNPRCSKSRQALEILRSRGYEPQVVFYLQDAPSYSELKELASRLGLEARDFLRHKEARMRELGLSLKDERANDDWLKIMAENPVLIERPIVVNGDRAVLGRPPEKVLELLGE
jgi:arsenate reductase